MSHTVSTVCDMMYVRYPYNIVYFRCTKVHIFDTLLETMSHSKYDMRHPEMVVSTD